MARQLASSHRATRRGVARTGTEPDRKASAVSDFGHHELDAGGETGAGSHAGTIRDGY